MLNVESRLLEEEFFESTDVVGQYLVMSNSSSRSSLSSPGRRKKLPLNSGTYFLREGGHLTCRKKISLELLILQTFFSLSKNMYLCPLIYLKNICKLLKSESSFSWILKPSDSSEECCFDALRAMGSIL